jgi:mannitol-1-phosphate/altronate dehydrogenase
MTNPYLRDTVDRVGRDPQRKLGWDDRLTGTMRVALRYGTEPWRYAVGAAAALATIDRSILEGDTDLSSVLNPLWYEASPDEDEQARVVALVEAGRARLILWLESGFQELET